MIRMVNLSCLKCGMSLDVEASHVQRYCPSCGGKLFISVNQMIDILDEKQEIRQKGVKYATLMSDVNIVERERSTKFDIRVFVITFLITLLIFFLTWKMSF